MAAPQCFQQFRVKKLMVFICYTPTIFVVKQHSEDSVSVFLSGTSPDRDYHIDNNIVGTTVAINY